MASCQTQDFPKTGDPRAHDDHDIYLVQIFQGRFARNRLDEDTPANGGSGVGNTQKAEFAEGQSGTPTERYALGNAMNSLRGLQRDLAFWQESAETAISRGPATALYSGSAD